MIDYRYTRNDRSYVKEKRRAIKEGKMKIEPKSEKEYDEFDRLIFNIKILETISFKY